MDDALDKLSHALEVEPEFHDGRSYMLHIKSQQQAKEVCIGRYSKSSVLWLLRLAFCRSHGRITFTIFGPFFYVENNLVQKSTVDDTVDYIIHNDSKLLA